MTTNPSMCRFSPPNKALELMEKWRNEGKYEVGELDHWEGMCVELAGEVISYAGKGSLVWIEPKKGHELDPDGIDDIWGYHGVAVIDGLVHCPWFPEVLPLPEWVLHAFPTQHVVMEQPGAAVEEM